MTLPFTPQTLPDRALIRLSGEGVLGFLHNLLTADVEGLVTTHMAYGALLSPQGKIQHELFVINQDPVVYVDCVRGQREDLVRKLVMYRLRAKIEIVAEDALAVAVGQGEPDPRLAEMGLRGLVPAGSLPPGEGYHAHRLALGLADGELDIGQNEHFPHEANLDLIHGVSFSKGCYVGQEVVSRMQHRGTVRSRMLPVVYEGAAPPRGTAITSGDVTIGTALGSVGQRGMALLRLDRLAEAATPLLSGGVSLTVHKPNWMKIDSAFPAVTP